MNSSRKNKTDDAAQVFARERKKIINRAKRKGVSEKQLFSSDSLFRQKHNFPRILTGSRKENE